MTSNLTHHPHCNRDCTPAGHTLTTLARDHAHLVVMSPQCALCREKLASTALSRGRR